jgi:hypothetical protein
MKNLVIILGNNYDDITKAYKVLADEYGYKHIEENVDSDYIVASFGSLYEFSTGSLDWFVDEFVESHPNEISVFFIGDTCKSIGFERQVNLYYRLIHTDKVTAYGCFYEQFFGVFSRAIDEGWL